MTELSPLARRRLFRAAYLVSFFLLATVAAELAGLLSSADFGSSRWRFGAFGFLATQLGPVLLALLLSLWVAAAADDRVLLVVIVTGSLLAALGLAVGLALYSLDALQTRNSVPLQSQTAFRMAAIKAALQGILGSAAFLGIGVAARRAWLDRRPRKRGAVVAFPGAGTSAQGDAGPTVRPAP
jgi:hypothetical protein